jgi:hypothetical protein
MLDYPPPITEGDSPMSHHKLSILAMCHEFSARTSLSKIAAVTGETAGAEDHMRSLNPNLYLSSYGFTGYKPLERK